MEEEHSNGPKSHGLRGTQQWLKICCKDQIKTDATIMTQLKLKLRNFMVTTM